MGDSYRPNRHGDDRFRGRGYDGHQNRRPHAGRHGAPPVGYGRRDQQYMIYDEPVEPPPYHGEKDAAKDDKAPWKVLLVLNLKKTVTEEIFAKGLDKVYREVESDLGAKPKSLKRVILIRDRKTDESMCFGFAEYHSIEDAQQALKKANMKKEQHELTIASTEINMCFPHAGVFPHDTADGKPERNPKFKFKLFTDAEHKYHDRRYYASFHDVNLDSPYPEPESAKSHNDSDRESAAKKTKKVATSLDGSSRKRKASAMAGPAIPSQWTKAQAELRGEDEDAEATRDTDIPPATGVNAITPTIKPTAAEDNSSEQTFVHQDEINGIICYLCSARFQQIESIPNHLQNSTKHASYLKDEKIVEQAYERLKKKDIDPATTFKLPPPPKQEIQQTRQNEEPRPTFRDRAAERRAEEAKTGGVGSGASQKVGFSLKKTKLDGTAASTDPSPSSDNEGSGKSKPTYGKALNMLAKQGYVEGQGLGSSGEGLAAPLEMNIYASGVGLGHEGSKKGDAVEEAEKATRGEGKGYAEAGKERLYERYHQL